MTELTYRQAIVKAQEDELGADDRVLLLGEDVAAAGGVFKTTKGLLELYGNRRVLDTPISEQAIIGCAIGAALCGLRPIAELMFADFAGVAFDQLANQLAKYRYMTGGQAVLPVTVRLANGAGAGFAAQHSQPVENWFLNIPGVKVVAPSSADDAYGLLRSAIRDDNPVLFFEHKNLLNNRADIIDDEAKLPPLGKASVVRTGGDVTIVANQQARYVAEEAADHLAAEGISATVIDPRTLVPFDDETVLHSLAETSRLIVVQEAPEDGSWGASLISRVATRHMDLLDAPPAIVAADSTPIPYAESLEQAWLPGVEDVVLAAKRLLDY